MGLTIMFEAAIWATMKCGARVYTTDACHLVYERGDLRLGLIEDGAILVPRWLPRNAMRVRNISD